MNMEIDFNEIYKEFHPKILHYLSRLINPHEAEDITQEVFEKVNRSLRNFRGESKLSTWLYRIANNTAIDRMRTSSFKRSFDNTSLEDTIGREMSECVREFIDKLPSNYKTVILLSELEGFKNKEIADILQISLDTVKIRLHRARAKLKALLNEGCDFYNNEQSALSCDRKPSQILPKPSK